MRRFAREFSVPVLLTLLLTLSACATSSARKSDRQAQASEGGRTVAWDISTPPRHKRRRKVRRSKYANADYKRRLEVATTAGEPVRPVW